LEAEETARIKELASSNQPEPDNRGDSPSVAAEPIGQDAAKGEKSRDLGRESVLREIEELRGKLKQRKLREDVIGDKAVGKARDEVVACLRLNDRRPLDCWKEVEAFKREVGRLERGFLGRVLD
jgi:MICOS complex subunit MIC19